MKNINIFQLKITIFTAVIYCSILHRRVCVMQQLICALVNVVQIISKPDKQNRLSHPYNFCESYFLIGASGVIFVLSQF